MSEVQKRFAIGAVSVCVFLLLWELSGRLELVNPLFTSYPTEVVREGLTLVTEDRFSSDVGISLSAFGVGFLMAIAVGVPLGLVLGRYRSARYFVEPTFMALYVTPRLTLLPVLVVWLGVGIFSTAAVVFLGAIFPVVISTMTGIKVLNPSWLRAATSFGAREREIFRKVMVPGSIPYILSGMRLGFGRALLGVIVAEMYVSTGGIGNSLIKSGQAFRVGRLMATVVLVATFGMACTLGLRAIEERILVWRSGARSVGAGAGAGGGA